ncbi:fimbria/pilus outer membrane usher protein [Buttiauxella selenatireducens]|uniref:Fimbria/pilus outer membrane usher protein n=1 Tax=Buttiauxella selenatireducens TaxID=3073902 RepID=A0ABY9SEL3_9ENTR|nr:fimbria/pilus outer membrane usher protein [Buttiauxella sp. R73]WMY75940.1 fimbria/pilus outer membrane usher protein [Buttiauxella sp. R73]
MNHKLFKHSALYQSLFSAQHRPLLSGALLAAFLGLGISPAALAEDTDDAEAVTFNSAFLGGVDKSIDISRFEKGNSLVAGEYQLDIFINDQFQGRGFVRISQGENSTSKVCFRGKDVAQWGLNLSKLPDAGKVTATLTSDCVELAVMLPDSTVTLDAEALEAHLSIPQIYLNSRLGGYVAPEFWDKGINAGFVSYNANAYQSHSAGGTESKNYYLGLNTGLNLLGWNIRHNGSLSINESESRSGSTRDSSYNSISTYAQHDIGSLEAMATVGQYYTPGDLFDAIPFTGVQVASDERMMPYSEKGFAPEIRGVAETNAKITVRQGNQVVYETSVAPGPFAINDMPNTGYAGDLNVTITEADGRTRSFVVPYASVSQLLRPGVSRFSATAGVYRDNSAFASSSAMPKFLQGTYRRGLSNRVTAYGGGIMANDYSSLLAGVALNTGFGAVALDVTTSHASGLPKTQETDESMNGQSYRVTYSKRLDTTSTDLALAAYRFSSSDYLSMQNFAQLKGNPGGSVYRPRQRFQLNVSQPIGDWGNVYLSGITESSWTNKTRSTTYQAGYGTSFSWGFVNITASRTATNGEYDNQISVMYSLPLGGSHGAMLSSTLNYQDKGRYNLQSNLSGSAGDRNQVNYNAYAGYNHDANNSSQQYGGNVNYNGSLMGVGGSASRSGDSTQYSLSARGTVIGYAGGIAMTSSQGETMAIVEADGANGAEVIGGSGGTVGWWGNTVVTSLSPYQNNSVLIDPNRASSDVEIQSGSANTVPRYGSISRLKFDTVVGKPVLVRGVMSNGKPLPFGADVLDKDHRRVSMVGQAGQVLLRGLPEKGTLNVKWGDQAGESCSLNYVVPEKTEETATGYRQVEAACR